MLKINAIPNDVKNYFAFCTIFGSATISKGSNKYNM